MDWNNDGKHDWQDHAFYNNVVEPGEKKNTYSGGKSSGKNTNEPYQMDAPSKGTVILVVICIVYFIIKLFS